MYENRHKKVCSSDFSMYLKKMHQSKSVLQKNKFNFCQLLRHNFLKKIRIKIPRATFIDSDGSVRQIK